MPGSSSKTYVVEHLDPELGAWSELEYITIAKETHNRGGTFVLSSLPFQLALPRNLSTEPGFKAEDRAVEEIYPEGNGKERVCLLDPAAEKDLSPDDGRDFDVFLFGGILGKSWPVCEETQRKGPVRDNSWLQT